jgi:hypothetical protein
MKKLIFALILSLCQPAHADGNELSYARSCTEQDWLSIEDDGPYRAIIKFSNSQEGCSNDFDRIITAPNGISARVIIHVGKKDETIQVIPQAGYQSDPPQGIQADDSNLHLYYVEGSIS